MNNTNDNFDSPLDTATSARLARLRTMPVDATGLAARLRHSIPELAGDAEHVSAWRLWIRPLRAAAALLIVVGTIFAVILASSGGTAVASIEQLAQLHEQTVADTSHAVQVDSIEAANVALARQWPKAPDLPPVPQDNVMSCCVHEIGRGKMACVVMNVDGQPVTITVARTSEVKCPMGTMVQRNGVWLCTHSVRAVNMVMVEHDGKWSCFMGKLPVERLAELAAKSARQAQPHEH